jgi:hypothetical protein
MARKPKVVTSGLPSDSTTLSSPFPFANHSRNRRSGRVTPDAVWRKEDRAPALQALVARVGKSRWSARLLRVLLEELHVEDEVWKLLGDVRRLRGSRSAQVVMVALAVRHSWRPDDFRRLVRRLGLKGTAGREGR